jgi:hypothetical protein
MNVSLPAKHLYILHCRISNPEAEAAFYLNEIFGSDLELWTAYRNPSPFSNVQRLIEMCFYRTSLAFMENVDLGIDSRRQVWMVLWNWDCVVICVLIVSSEWIGDMIIMELIINAVLSTGLGLLEYFIIIITSHLTLSLSPPRRHGMPVC